MGIGVTRPHWYVAAICRARDRACNKIQSRRVFISWRRVLEGFSKRRADDLYASRYTLGIWSPGSIQNAEIFIRAGWIRGREQTDSRVGLIARPDVSSFVISATRAWYIYFIVWMDRLLANINWTLIENKKEQLRHSASAFRDRGLLLLISYVLSGPVRVIYEFDWFHVWGIRWSSLGKETWNFVDCWMVVVGAVIGTYCCIANLPTIGFVYRAHIAIMDDYARIIKGVFHFERSKN